MRPVRAALSGIVLAGLLYAGARPIGAVPALGAMLDPANGVWAVARGAAPAAATNGEVPGLGAEVRVMYDARGVPHIFAATENDAYRALGYVVARDRLFQLELQTRAASGTLTALAGARALDMDRETRRLGMPRAAERKLAFADSASASAQVLRAYADGVNAYIDAMPASELPVEYRLLGARPARWEPINSLHLMNRMGWTLAYIAPELDRAAAAGRVGAAAAAALFPANTPIQEPIQPNGQRAPRFDVAPLPAPAAPDERARLASAAMAGFFGPSGDALRARAQDPDDARAWMASNNWAVSPARTTAGRALLAGDPHLELTLPSIWYEAHIVVPGRLDVYGVTIPGAPGIVIGFNRDVAWTFTNTGADVLDFYRETVDDDARPTRYRVDGEWRALERRVETYRDAAGATIATDTLLFTHRGPMRRAENGDARARWVSMRWTVLEPSNEMAAFQQAARARTVADFQRAMAEHYRSPAQNMLVADRAGTIAIRSTGRFPVRPDTLGGIVERDGSLSASDWRGDRPSSEYPQSVNPAQGFLASANQQPVDPRASGGYWGGSYDPWRAMRINALLRADSQVTPDAMRRYQTDPGSERANLFVPAFLAAADAMRTRTPGADGERVREAARLLAQWDRRYTRENARAVLFEAAMRELVERTWDELIDPASARDAEQPPTAGADRQRRGDAPPVATRRVATPSSAVLAGLLSDPASAWWDDARTAAREDRDAILAASLAAALDRTRRERGEPDAGAWEWSRVRHANIGHLLGLPGFGVRGLAVQGGPATLSPSSGNGAHGASWRMVVELGPEVTAWGTYPGGQSGNPASPRYTDRVAQWQAGRLDSLVVPRTAAEMTGGATVLTLRPRQ